MNGNATNFSESTWVLTSKYNLANILKLENSVFQRCFSCTAVVKVSSPLYHDQDDKNVDISLTKEPEEH